MNRVCSGRVSRAVICVLSVLVLCTAFPAAAPQDGVSDVGVRRPVVAASLPWIAGELPLLALTGLFCLAASFSLRRLWVRDARVFNKTDAEAAARYDR
jgi:hypothetical protein